jgi:hypothetical protein
MEQYKMVTHLTNQIAPSVNARTAGPLSEDELEASTEAGEIAQQTVGQRKRKRKVPNPDKKAAKAAEAERVRNVLMHQHECAVDRDRGDYTPPLGWMVSDRAAVMDQLQRGLLSPGDNFFAGRKFIQRFGVDWFEGTVVKRGTGSMSDCYHVDYIEKDGKTTGCRHKCVATGYGRLASNFWCVIEKAPQPKGRRRTLKMDKGHHSCS